MTKQNFNLDRLIDRISDGTIDRKELSELQARLLADPALRKQFRSRMRMEANLHAECQKSPAEIVSPMMLGAPRPVFWRWPLAVGMAAALVIGAFFAFFPRPVETPEIVATIESQDGAAWSAGSLAGNGVDLVAGIIKLERGVASLRFESGAVASLEAPVTLELIDPMRCRLSRGKAIFEVPDSAIGFVVETPNGYAVDHGTRFAVGLQPDGEHVEFGVLEGRISVHHDTTQSSKEVRTGGMVMLSPFGIGKADRAVETSPPASDDTILLRLRTNGHETSIVRGDMREDFLDPGLLMVKKDMPMANESDSNRILWAKDRRSLIAFKLDELQKRQVKHAKLRLNIVPSDRGYAWLLPERTTIQIYGIRDAPELENWHESQLTWADAPGSIGDTSQIDTSEVILLGAFDIARSRLEGLVVFESPELNRFVNQDSTGVAGFLLVSDSKPLDSWSMVHAFASSRHVEAAGPLLELTVEQDESTKK